VWPRRDLDGSRHRRRRHDAAVDVDVRCAVEHDGHHRRAFLEREIDGLVDGLVAGDVALTVEVPFGEDAYMMFAGLEIAEVRELLRRAVVDRCLRAHGRRVDGDTRLALLDRRGARGLLRIETCEARLEIGLGLGRLRAATAAGHLIEVRLVVLDGAAQV
jgi:hypothetical protein